MRARRLLPWLGLAAVVVASLVVAAGSGGDAGTSPATRVERISEELRCPTCQGLSVADSPSSTARAIRDDVARRIAQGESDDEIKAAYVDRYGEWILLRPSASGVGSLVWALPAAGLVVGAAGLGLAFRRWRREPRLEASEADRALVERARVAAADGGEPG